MFLNLLTYLIKKPEKSLTFATVQIDMGDARFPLKDASLRLQAFSVTGSRKLTN